MLSRTRGYETQPDSVLLPGIESRTYKLVAERHTSWSTNSLHSEYRVLMCEGIGNQFMLNSPIHTILSESILHVRNALKTCHRYQQGRLLPNFTVDRKFNLQVTFMIQMDA